MLDIGVGFIQSICFYSGTFKVLVEVNKPSLQVSMDDVACYNVNCFCVGVLFKADDVVQVRWNIDGTLTLTGRQQDTWVCI